MNSLALGGYRITGNLNEGIGDAGIGTPSAGITGLPTVEGAYAQLGVNVFLSTSDLASYTNTSKTNSTLYGGWYKYVQFKSTWSATLAIGQPLYYATVADMLNSIITADCTAAGIFAGYSLNSSVSKGNYWWIQTGGITWALCKATVTTTTAGDIAVQTDATTGTTDSIADATDYYTTALKGGKLFRGQWLDAPANAGLKRMLMQQVPLFQ